MNKKYHDKKLIKIFKARTDEAIRLHCEEEHEIREKFDRDRDRILYSKAFRRLIGKTQVFLSGDDDHVRNRMTHTIEVSQISRTISKALGLNEILTEAIALGHDLGHTPFGHVGERTLNYIMCGCDEIRDFSDCLSCENGFKHNWQGLRVTTDLESSINDNGLNLTKYTMWGILNHSSIEYSKPCKYNLNNNICTLRRHGNECKEKDKYKKLDFYKDYKNILTNQDLTIEALIVGLSDEIAQRHHDIEDALETKILTFDELYEKLKNIYGGSFEGEDSKRFEKINSYEDRQVKVSQLGSFLVNFLTFNAIKNINKNLLNLVSEYNLKEYRDFDEHKRDENFCKELKSKIDLSSEVLEKDKEFQNYVSKRILNSYKAQSMDGKGNYIIRELFKAYVTNPQQLPDKTIKRLFINIKKTINTCKLNDEVEFIKFELKENSENESEMTVGELRNTLEKLHSSNNNLYKRNLMRTICDYIAGMTDKYAMKLYSNLYETY